MLLPQEEKIKYINECLNILKTYVHLNDICIVCEDFFCEFLNILFDYNLINSNRIRKNFKGIYLIAFS